MVCAVCVAVAVPLNVRVAGSKLIPVGKVPLCGADCVADVLLTRNGVERLPGGGRGFGVDRGHGSAPV